MRNMRQMNQVKRARCSTAMFTQSPFFPSLRRLVGLCEDFFQDPYCLRKGKLKKHCVRLHFRYNCFDAETRSIFGRLQVKRENRSRSKNGPAPKHCSEGKRGSERQAELFTNEAQFLLFWKEGIGDWLVKSAIA